jgi:putative nucleotidyltransferase with HDIG domain
MNKLSVFTDVPRKRDVIRRKLDGFFELEFLELDEAANVTLQPNLLFDVDFRDCPRLLGLKECLKRKAKGSRVVFVTDKTSHIQVIQAHALGATDIVHRPLDAGVLARKLSSGFIPIMVNDPIRLCAGVGPALEALHDLFSTACLGAPLDAAALNVAGDSIVGHIEEQGLRSWIDTVRRHHCQTYQHCLLVTGVAVAFGQTLGFSPSDRHRLAMAGMVHDIGKARVPIEILEKPTPLSNTEMEVLRKHPELGLDTLKNAPGINPEMLDIVIHHHEYLDGSGYPHGLSGNEISDFVRVSTICDVFGALLERRAYKPPIPGDVAYQMLLDMGPKLDKDFVRAFDFASMLRLEEGV